MRAAAVVAGVALAVVAGMATGMAGAVAQGTTDASTPETAEPRPPLAEVMAGATAMTSMAPGYLFVSNAEGGWVCAINVKAAHFAALMARDDVVAEQTVPGTLCVPATHFDNLAE